MSSRKGLNNSIWSIDETLIGTTTQGQSGPGSNGSEGELHIHQSSRSGASPSDSLVSHSWHSGGILPSAEMQSAYSTALAD